MAKYHLDHLKKKFGWTGKKYNNLMSKILEINSKNISKEMRNITLNQFKKEAKKVKKTKKRFVIPDLELKEIFFKKSAERGKLLTDNLRDNLTDKLKKSLKDSIAKRGITAGELKKDVINNFKKEIKKTFENYKKIDPKYGIPSNIHNIATFEIRSVINESKDEYLKEFLNKNEDKIITKTWKHNTRLVKKRREHHFKMNGTEIKFNQYFKLYNPETKRTYKVNFPHEPNLPLEEKIGCQCELIYNIRNI